MLPRELLVVRKRKGTIKPCYLSDTTLVEELIQIFTQYQGQKYKKLLEKREELEGDNFKVIRGLSTLLERRCSFVASSDLSGKEVRSFLFEHGFVTTLEERDKLLDEASQYFHASKQKVEEAMKDMPSKTLLRSMGWIEALYTIDVNISISQRKSQ